LDLLGKLRFLADRTRQALAFPASILARFAGKPNRKHHSLMMHLLRYVGHTKDDKLLIGSAIGEVKLFAYADASFVRERDSMGQLGIYRLIQVHSFARARRTGVLVYRLSAQRSTHWWSVSRK